MDAQWMAPIGAVSARDRTWSIRAGRGWRCSSHASTDGPTIPRRRRTRTPQPLGLKWRTSSAASASRCCAWGSRPNGAGLIAFQEQQDHAVVVAGNAGVVGHPGRADVRDELAVESVCAPEGLVVDEERLHGRAVRQPLGELVADAG